ncbi:hypothetical protein FRC17_006819 [Serendipita sp. 399]|nr:hypothetical protein FRC17_006819 [Serendipita sp. 399]
MLPSMSIGGNSGNGAGGSTSSPLNDPNQRSPDPSSSSPPSPTVAAARLAEVQAPVPIPTFTNSTPILRVAPSGTLSVDMDAVQRLGIDLSFRAYFAARED